MKQVFFLIGLPASGKTTYIKNVLSKQYESSNAYHVASTDDIVEELASDMKKDYNTIFKNVRFSIIQELFDQRLFQAFSSGKDVIWDQTNLSKKSRLKKLKIIPKDYKKIAVVFNINEEVRKERSIKRDMEGGKLIPNHIIEQMLKTANYSLDDEGFAEIIEINN